MKILALPSFALGAVLVLAGPRPGTSTAAPPDPEPGVRSAAAAPSPGPHGGTSLDADDANQVIQRTCGGCHNDRRLRGNLSLESFDVATAGQNAETAERMIRKLRAGMMPPPGARRPGADTLVALVEQLEDVVDRYAASHPDPGSRSFQRLNQPEYEAAVKDLLGLDVDAGEWLPLDQKSANFDNIADAQPLSPTLLEAYLNAAAAISRMAVGDPQAAPTNVAYKIPEYVSQNPWDHVDGAPYGTRGGLVVDHAFPADGQYVLEMTFASGENAPLEDVDVSIDGERVALLDYTRMGEGADGRGSDPMFTDPIVVRAGQHKLAVTFVRRSDGPYEDLIRPHVWSMAGGGSGGPGITTLPHLRSVIVHGPTSVTGVSASPSRQKIFTCRPTAAPEEEPCARSILTRLATEAYRRPVSDDEVDGLMGFYRDGASQHGFEAGVRSALEAILSSPFFVLRFEPRPGDVKPGESYALGDWAMASRLSFFLWGTPPDQQLMDAARSGHLHSASDIEREARRMLADPRSEALGTRFAAQWLRLQDLYKVHPDPNFFPNFDENLADAMHQETELFFNSLVREDRSVLDLFTADYTYVNERLARHYGIPGVSGPEFRRVTYPDGRRRGILGQGSVLVLTSLANRTSPVLRGKWVMEVLMGTPPPPPPPGVPALDETAGAKAGHVLTTRERMEQHRKSPACSSCHSMMDPIGLALDNFDPTGKWRERENGSALDTRGDFYDGTPISSPAELGEVLLKRPLPLVRTFTENLMAYALGRRVEYYDQPTIRKIVKDAEGDGYRMSDLILGVVKSDAFRMKKAPVATTQDAAASGR